MKFYSVGKFAELIGVSPQTLREWEKNGKLLPHHKTDTGYRYYSEEQYNTFIHSNPRKDRMVIGYCRVSTPAQKDDLETQIQNVKTYMLSRGYQFEIIKDIGSGINYKKAGLQELIKKILNFEVSKVVVLYKDRLIRFGFELIEYVCNICGTEIEIIDNTERSKEQELTDDLIQIITVFANRLYGSRSSKTKHLIEEVKLNADRKDDSPEADSGAGDSSS